MIGCKISLQGDEALKDNKKPIVHLQNPNIHWIRLEGGMASGKSSIAISFEHEGKVFVLETSMAIFEAVAAAMQAAEQKQESDSEKH